MKLAFRHYAPARSSQSELLSSGSFLKRGRSAPRIVVLHGLLGHRRNWASVAASLSNPALELASSEEAETRTRNSLSVPLPPLDVYCADLRNHGDSPHGPHTLHDLAMDIDLFLEERSKEILAKRKREVDRVVTNAPVVDQGDKIDYILLGHSMGGMAALQYLWDFQRKTGAQFRGSDVSHRVVGAIAVDISPSRRPPVFDHVFDIVGELRKLPLLQTDCTSAGARPVQTVKAADQYLRDILKIDDKFLRQHIVGNLVPAKPAAVGAPKQRSGPLRWQCNLENIFAGKDAVQWRNSSLSDTGASEEPVDIPTLFIFGELSPYYNDLATSSIPVFFSNSTIDVIEGVGHFVHIFKRKEIIASMGKFMIENDVVDAAKE